MKDRAYAVNIDESKSIRIHCIVLYVNGNGVTFLIALLLNIFQKKSKNFFKHIPKEIKRFICNKNIITNIFRINVYDSIM